MKYFTKIKYNVTKVTKVGGWVYLLVTKVIKVRVAGTIMATKSPTFLKTNIKINNFASVPVIICCIIIDRMCLIY